GGHPGDAPAVIGGRGGDAGAVGAVAVFVIGIPVVVDIIVTPDHFSGQVGMVILDTGVDNGDRGVAASLGDIPGGGRLDLFLPPTVGWKTGGHRGSTGR